MFRLFPLVALAFIANTANAELIPASSDPCQLDRLQVKFGDVRYSCGKQVALDTFTNGDAKSVRVDVTLDGRFSEENKIYTLVMVDPDAPSTLPSYWVHWLVTNIAEEDFAHGYHSNTNSENEILGYKPPSPPSGKPHRYQFFTFKQPKQFGSGEIKAPNRGGFDLASFQSRYNLVGPIAGYQILTERM
ncbi:protein D3-like [Acanthaster planci]|uniref:Protein D3-like n=1 Tax=Acanthaster planci TaxID=133434 RepID=A0A8B7Y2V9_ACAPL|nr:protein D3-like [Acanthaster planci]